MRFLADESCDFGVVLALRTAGRDVAAIAEVSPREEDDSVMKRALQEERIVVTQDKDFGQLVYANRQATGGCSFSPLSGKGTDQHCQNRCRYRPTARRTAQRKVHCRSTRPCALWSTSLKGARCSPAARSCRRPARYRRLRNFPVVILPYGPRRKLAAEAQRACPSTKLRRRGYEEFRLW